MNKRSFLFLDPIRIIAAVKLDEIPGLFLQVEEALTSGLYAAGYMSYEAGYHFERFAGLNLPTDELPLAWFGVYRNPVVYDHETGTLHGASAYPAIGSLENSEPASEDLQVSFADRIALEIGEEDYAAKIRKVKQYIEQGDTYQVNFTDKVRAPVKLSPEAAFRSLLRQQPVAYGAFLHLEGHHILSLSPELFFRTEQGKIVTRPMKGTMPRGLDAAEDREAAIRLRNDEKNRCEHVMIVDLLRNDLGRICTMGSIQVEDIFSVEKYKTLLQMTSTISGALRPGLGYYDIFKSMFPSGSVTGAPKIRTMQIIQELERGPRGIYTGSIGFFSPGGSSAFNVAIRTIVIKENKAFMGVGGGIVADSDPEGEYRECLLKAAFLARSMPSFQLLETMLWDREFVFLAQHLDRLESSAAYFDFSFDRAAAESQLMASANLLAREEKYQVRLLLDATGGLAISTKPFLPDQPTGRVRLATERTASRGVFLRHKTTNRKFYDEQYAQGRAEGFDDVIFLNEHGHVTEGAISNLFIQKAGNLITPPLACGVLPGIFRSYLLETQASAQERTVTLEDLQSADDLFLCNSVRGMRRMKTLFLDASLSIDFTVR